MGLIKKVLVLATKSTFLLELIQGLLISLASRSLKISEAIKMPKWVISTAQN